MKIYLYMIESRLKDWYLDFLQGWSLFFVLENNQSFLVRFLKKIMQLVKTLYKSSIRTQ